MALSEHLQKLKQSTDQITKLLTEGYDRENGDEVSGKLTEYTSLLATSSVNVATAEMLYNDARLKIVESYQTSGYSQTDKKYILDGRLKNELFFVTLTDRQNSALVHTIDAIRSQLSYLKEERKLQGVQ